MKKRIQDVIDFLTTPSLDIENSVDGLEFGKQDDEVRGIAVTFLATQEIIEEALSKGANLVISHEGIFYSHCNKQKELASNRVYRQKCKMIEESGIAVYRYHDHIHRYMPDAVTAGLLHSLKWQAFETENRPSWSVVEIWGMTLQDIIRHVKNCLGMQYVRYMGDLSSSCVRIGLLVGYRGGGDPAVPLCDEKDLDLLIYGEGPEWETPEYIRDAVYQGRRKALIVLGHAESEAPGMEHLAGRIKDHFPGLPVHFIPQKPLFRIL